MDNKIERKYPNPEDFKTEDEWFDACMKLRSQPEREETQEETFTRIEVMKMMESYADHVYKGYYVHKHDVEDILETLSPSKIIDEFKTRKTP